MATISVKDIKAQYPDKIICISYNSADIFKTRKSAMKFFMQGAMGSEGSEAERYTTIITKLHSGWNVASDDEDIYCESTELEKKVNEKVNIRFK